jgi:DNA repair exonuclease SbcCD ATPase subunit
MTTRKTPQTPRKQVNVEWLFHEDNGAICHDDDDCDICRRWRTHYHDENGKTGTFEQACSDRERWFRHKVLISLDGTDRHQDLAAQSREIEQLRETSTLERLQTIALREDLRKAKEKLQTESGCLRRDLGTSHYKLRDTMRKLEDAQRKLENAQQELENNRHELRNTQLALEFTRQQQVRTPPPRLMEDTTTSSTAPVWIILSP